MLIIRIKSYYQNKSEISVCRFDICLEKYLAMWEHYLHILGFSIY